MKLSNFINELEKIQKQVNDSDKVDVLMADYISVVKPIYFKPKNVVFITDVDKDDEVDK